MTSNMMVDPYDYGLQGAPGSCQVPGFTSFGSDQSEGCCDSPAAISRASAHNRVDQLPSPVRPSSDDDLIIGASDSRTLWQCCQESVELLLIHLDSCGFVHGDPLGYGLRVPGCLAG